MNAPGIAFQELIDDNEAAALHWQQWLAANAAALEVPCDIYHSSTVRDVVKHIFAVELRHSQRLRGVDVTPYDAIPSSSLEDLFSIHAQALANLRSFLIQISDAALRETIEIQTVSAGTVRCTRRKLLAHVLLHSMRHWAQLTTALRQHGFQTNWPKDLLFSEALR